MIRAAPRPDCHVCGRRGVEVYAVLRDRLLAAPGTWRLVGCPAPTCGLLWLDPMPLAADLALAYDGYVIPESRAAAHAGAGLTRRVREGYLARRHGAFGGGVPAWQRALGMAMALRPLRREEVDASLMHLRVPAGGRLLDVGCASGARLVDLEAAGWHAEGLDLDAGAVAAGRARGRRIEQGTLEEARHPDASFDAVTMSHVLEHLPDPAAALREVHRILKPRGWLAILTPNVRARGHRRHRAAWFALDPPRHLHLFTVPALARLLAEAGLPARVLRTSARGAHEAAAASRAIAREGRWRVGAPPGWRGRAARWAEWLALRVDAEAGTEIVAIAEKPGPPGGRPRA